MPEQLIIRQLGRQAYEPVWHAMQEFTDQRDAETVDELWIVEHDPVFTQGQAGKAEHVLAPGDIPVVQVDRGGQVTYHGPGQLVIYFLLDIRRLSMGVRQLVNSIENTIKLCPQIKKKINMTTGECNEKKLIFPIAPAIQKTPTNKQYSQ